MLKVSWHIGDVFRKLRTLTKPALTQGAVYGRASTLSNIERGGNFEQASVITAAELLSKALIKKGVISAPLSVEDLNALVPVPRNEVSRSQPLDADAVDVALMFQRLSVAGKATARGVMQALATQADLNAGGLHHAGSATGTTQR